MPKTVTIISENDIEGFSVASALCGNPDYDVLMVTKNGESGRVQQLQNRGVRVILGGLDDGTVLREALHGVDCAYVSTCTDFSRKDAIEDEFERGKRLALMCQKCNVGHVVYSTQLNTKTSTGVVARHMVAKARVEQFMKSTQLSLTSLIVPCLYEELFTVYKPTRRKDGSYALAIPMGDTPLDLISSDDIGHVVAAIFDHKSQYLHKTVSCAGDKLTVREMCDVMNRHLHPLRFRDIQVTIPQFVQHPMANATDLAAMFDFFTRVDQKHNVIATQKMCPGVKGFGAWVGENRERLMGKVMEQDC